MPVSTNQPLAERIGLFDSDCLELSPGDAACLPSLPGFSLRERMQPLADKVDALYALSATQHLKTVFTHCCSARAVTPGGHPDVLVVPRNGGKDSWKRQVPQYRLINIEKHHAAPPNESFICRHFDAFQHNANASQLFESLDIPQWVVFGHGFDLCVDSSVKGILMAGYRVHLLTDVIASSASGYGPYGTDFSREATLAYLKKIGVTTGTLDAFLAQYAA